MASAEHVKRLTEENRVLRMATEQWEHQQKMLLDSNERLNALGIEMRGIRERIERSLTAGDLAWWDWDYSTGRMFYNHERGRLLGYTMEELPRNFGEVEKLIHPDDYNAVAKRFSRRMAGEELDPHFGGDEACEEAVHQSGSPVSR